jgi:hypothetical protein
MTEGKTNKPKKPKKPKNLAKGFKPLKCMELTAQQERILINLKDMVSCNLNPQKFSSFHQSIRNKRKALFKIKQLHKLLQSSFL